MRSTLSVLATGFALSITFASLLANASEEAKIGHAEAGETKSALCASCHGADGNSAVPSFPKIAGQPAGYIAKQLADFKSDTRVDATMKGMVAALSEQDMLDLDAFYAAQPANESAVISEAQAEAAHAGEETYRAGLAKFSVTPCMACHQADGAGLEPQFPRLAGQHASYIEKQLNDFKTGARQDAMMNGIAFPLSAQQIKDLALYISGLK